MDLCVEFIANRLYTLPWK